MVRSKVNAVGLRPANADNNNHSNDNDANNDTNNNNKNDDDTGNFHNKNFRYKKSGSRFEKNY